MGDFGLVKDVTATVIDDLVHQIHQIALLVVLLVLLGELLDNLVDKLTEGVRAVLAFVSTLVQQFQELTQVLLAVLVRVGLVDQPQSAHENFQTLTDRLVLEILMEEELLKDSYGGQTEVTVAESHKEVILHLNENIVPGI